MGQLSLSLRSIADNNAELERAIAAGEVKVQPGANPTDERRMLLAVASRPMDTNTTYTTGGDVSRFQRRSVPARAPSAGQQVGDSLSQFANALMGKSSPGSGQGTSGPVSGPSVRVTRGNTVTVVPVGAR
jgi:pilus assembly protein CpaB